MRWRLWAAAGCLAALIALAGGVPAQAETTAAAREAGSGLATGRRQVQGLEGVRAVAASGDVYAALMGDGSVRAIGDLDGDGRLDFTPVPVDMGCAARSIAVGQGTIAAVCGDGSVAVINTSRSNIKSQRVANLGSVKAVNLGRPGLLALRSDGTVWFASMSGNGLPAQGSQVQGLADVVAIAAGIDDAVAVHADGTASRLAIKEKGIPVKRLAGLPPVKGVSVCGPDDDCDGADGYIFVTVKGEVLTPRLGVDGSQRLITLGGPVCNPCAVAGHDRTLLLSAAGGLSVATVDAAGKVTASGVDWPSPRLKQVATGRSLDMGLATDGTVWVWDAPRSAEQVPGLASIRDIAAADDRACAVDENGQVLCWSNDMAARTFVAPHVLEVKSVRATHDYWLVLHTDGSISLGRWPAAGGTAAEPEVHLDVAAEAVGNCCRGHVIIMKFDGTVEEARITSDGQGIHLSDFTPVQGLDRIIQVAGTDYGYLAVRADGAVLAVSPGRPPSSVKELTGAVSAACGSTACAVAMGDGSVRGIAIDEPGVHVWGDPHVDQAAGPIAVGGGGGGGGSGSVIVVRADGTVVDFGERVTAGTVTGVQSVITVVANAQWNLMLRADGTVWRWRASGPM